jgi:DNA-binding NarL/FixJ family response regulator
VRVLIIDNSAAVRQRLLDLIRVSSGIEQVWQAADAAAALTLARDQPLDVAIVDLALGPQNGSHGGFHDGHPSGSHDGHPGGSHDGEPSGSQSGLDLIRQLRMEQARMVVIVLTNSSTDAHRQECLRRGAHFFFDKSHDFERAIAVIGEVAASRDSA